MPTSPIVKLRMQLAPPLASLSDAGSPTGKAVYEALTSELAECLDALGVPGKPEVEIAVEAESTRSVRWFVHGVECHYADEVPKAAWWFVRGELPRPVDPDGQRAWVDSIRSAGVGVGWTTEQVASFFRLFLGAVLEQRPSVLMGVEHTRAYATRLADAGHPWDSDGLDEWLGPILRKVLDMGLSIGNLERLRFVVNEGRDRGAQPLDIVEELIADLTPDKVEIHANLEFIKRISLASDSAKQIPLMRDGIFYEMGIRIPHLRFVPSHSMSDRSFAFKINDWRTMPQVGLPPGEVLVNVTVDQLKLFGMTGKPATNPAYGNKWSTISDTDREPAEGADLTAWSELGYIILSLSAHLRRRGARLVNTRSVDGDLAIIASSYPDLVARVRDKFGIERLTQVLRNLASEEISIRNLTAVLGHLLDFDYIRCDSKLIVFDDRMPAGNLDESCIEDPQTFADFVRSRMKRYISDKQTRGGPTLSVYLLSPEIEQLLAGPETEVTKIYEAVRDGLFDAIAQEIGNLPPNTQIPPLLTIIEVRSRLRRLIQPRFPELPVLCYQELSPDLGLTAIAKISV